MESSHNITQIQESDALSHSNQVLDIIDQTTDSSHTIDQLSDNESQQYRHVQVYRRRGKEVTHSPALRDISPWSDSTAIQPRRNMLIANGGDSRAVLGKRCRAVELSKDHKSNCTSERPRIEKMGGVVCDGYLNGQLSVARALRSE
ncbi:hypothetical protein Droror1_Dr00002389 [Drosera rotundifolia]